MILAIDLGSTFFKAAVFDARPRLLAEGRHRLAHRFGGGGLVEIDAAAVQAALRGALAAVRVRERDIRIVAVTSQAQTCTLVDAAGRAQQPFVSWQDTRATAARDELERLLKDFGAHSSFAEILPGLQVSHLRRLRPGAGVMPLNLPSYLVRLWTGESVTDDNLAAMSGLYSLRARGWWPPALRACGLREDQMPAVVAVGGIGAATTRAAERFGLPAGVPVVLAGNDQTAGGVAARLDEREALLLTLGTAQAVYTCRRRMPRPMSGTIRGPYPGGRFYRMAADARGGSIVNWAQTVIAGCGDDERFFREAARAPRGCRGLTFDASLDRAAGSWRGLALHHTRADFARSVLESLSLHAKAMVERVGKAGAGRYVLAAGGGSRQPLWRRIAAETLGVRVVATPAGPLLGAARMAARHVHAKGGTP